jgi:hypothetical protein
LSVDRLRLLMVAIAVAVIGAGVGLANVLDTEPMNDPTNETVNEEVPPVAVGTPATTSTGPPAPTPAVLLPNPRSQPASDVSIETTTEGRRLRFAATLANRGPGPLEVVPDDSGSCPAGQRYAVQRLYVDVDDNQTFGRVADVRSETRPAGCMVDHPEHDHWHFDAMARYTLTAVGSTTPITENAKVSFCLRDNITLAASVTQPRHYGECQTRLSVQGISPGWADVYSARLADQVLDLPDGLADGTYCLHTEADPYRRLREVDPTDNAAVLTVQIAGTTVVPAPTNQCETLPPLG